MKIMFYILLALTIFSLWNLTAGDSGAMAECQKTYSFETCFHTFNR